MELILVDAHFLNFATESKMLFTMKMQQSPRYRNYETKQKEMKMEKTKGTFYSLSQRILDI